MTDRKQRKRFACNSEGCTQSYSRLEHLERHRLNRTRESLPNSHAANPIQILDFPRKTFHCEFSGCTSSFVRQDLYKRHFERHFPLHRQNSAKCSEDSISGGRLKGNISGSLNHVKKRRVGRPRLSEARLAYLPRNVSSNVETTQDENLGPAEINAVREDILQNNDQTREATTNHIGSEQNTTTDTFSGLQSFGPSSLSGTTFMESGTQPREDTTVPDASRSQPFHFSFPPPGPQIVDFDYGFDRDNPDPGQVMQRASITKCQPVMTQLDVEDSLNSNGYNVQTFGDPSNSNRDEFMNWWFEEFQNFSSNTAPLGMQVMVGIPSFNEQWAHGQFLHPFTDASISDNEMQDQYMRPHQSYPLRHSLNMWLTETRWRHLLDYMQTSFLQSTTSTGHFDKSIIFSGSLELDEHVLSLKNMNVYIDCYWRRFHEQMPILHEPTFSADHVPELLLLAVILLGGTYYVHHDDLSSNDQLQNFTSFAAWHLRWHCFMNDDFHPPSKLWIFQTLILLEVYEKMAATRVLHERANLHYATTINIIRRANALVENAFIANIPREGITPREWWNRWIIAEATRRAVFAAFLLDSTHASMFGHFPVMITHEIQLYLPCDEVLWSATSPSEVGRLEASLYTNNVKPTTFLRGLKRMLNGHDVRANAFGRIILLAGLQSISWQVKQREFQMSILGLPLGLGVPGTWRKTLITAFDFWKSEFEKDNAHRQRAFLAWQPSEAILSNELTAEYASIMYHLGYLTMNLDIVEAQILAGATRVLGRHITDTDRSRVHKRLVTWRRSPEADSAFHHAVELLVANVAGSTNDLGMLIPYSARDDCLVIRPWVLYYAALTAWCYIYLNGDSGAQNSTPSSTSSGAEESRRSSRRPSLACDRRQVSEANIQSSFERPPTSFSFSHATVAQAQLSDRQNSASSNTNEPRLAGDKMDVNKLGTVLEYLCVTFRDSRWELLHEASRRLEAARMMLKAEELA